MSGYLIGSQATGKLPLPPKAELQWWYQYYFATENGRAGYDKYRHDFAKLILTRSLLVAVDPSPTKFELVEVAADK